MRKIEPAVRKDFVQQIKNLEVEVDYDKFMSDASRLCKFPITGHKFPLTIQKAIIGPKCPEQGSNVDQFNYMKRQTKTMPES